MLKNKKILITGATGFIGANLVRKFLKFNADIYILIRSTSNKWRIRDVLGNVKEYALDLLNYKETERLILEVKPKIIFHAAVYGGYPFQCGCKDIFDVNLTGTINLLAACCKIDFELFINTGSSSEYGIKDKPMVEGDLLEPVNDYGVSKASATLYCQALAKRESRPITTLRLFSPYGYYEGGTRLIPSVIMSCLKKENPRLSSPESMRDFVFVEDVMDAYVKAIENKGKAGGRIFNIGSGVQHSVGDVVEKIIALTDSKVKPEWGSVPNPRLESTVWLADVSKAKDILGWQARSGLSSGIYNTVGWFKNNLFLY